MLKYLLLLHVETDSSHSGLQDRESEAAIQSPSSGCGTGSSSQCLSVLLNIKVGDLSSLAPSSMLTKLTVRCVASD